MRAPRYRRDMRPDSGRAREERVTAPSMMSRTRLEVKDEYCLKLITTSYE